MDPKNSPERQQIKPVDFSALPLTKRLQSVMPMTLESQKLVMASFLPELPFPQLEVSEPELIWPDSDEKPK